MTSFTAAAIGSPDHEYMNKHNGGYTVATRMRCDIASLL